MSRLFIGMPVFNGACFIASALESLLAQGFNDWSLLISDNRSSDHTEDICKEFVDRDSRISYTKQSTNLGAINNFRFVLGQAKSEYFMWAAADDEWSKDYLGFCISALDSYPNVQFVGGNVVNIDPTGSVLRSYDGFSCFDSETQLPRLTNFLFAPEIDGKANLIYSMYRTEFCRVLCKLPNVFCGWGSDMTFVFAGLNRGRYKYIPDILLHKRVIDSDDIKTTVLAENKEYRQLEYFGWFPITHFHEYREAYFKLTIDNRAKVLVELVMVYRYVALWCRLKIQSLLSFLMRRGYLH